MATKLAEIPGLDPAVQTVWKVRALVIGDRNPVLAALDRWSREHPAAYKSILKVRRRSDGVRLLHVAAMGGVTGSYEFFGIGPSASTRVWPDVRGQQRSFRQA